MNYIPVQQLLDIANNVCGQDVAVRCRKWPLPLMRYMVIQRLHEQGESISRSARIVGIDHSTALHGLQLLKDLGSLPENYEKQLYRQFHAEVERQSVQSGSSPERSQV